MANTSELDVESTSSELDVESTSSELSVTVTTSTLLLEQIPLEWVLSIGVLVESSGGQVTSTLS